MIEKIETLLSEIEQLTVSAPEEVEMARIKYLSKKGSISSLMDDFRTVPPEQKREVGMRLNELKQKATEKIELLKKQFENDGAAHSNIDLSRTAYPIPLGTRHHLSIIKE